jgi:hypothetical protein
LVNLSVSLLLLLHAHLALHVFVLDGVDGGDAHLELREHLDALGFGHFAVFAFELLEGVAC